MSRSQRHLTRGVTAAAVALVTSILFFGFAAVAAAQPGQVTGITSATHPEEAAYYPSAGPRFSWDPAVADGWAIAGYSFVLDQDPSTVPDATTDRNSLTYLPRVAYSVGAQPSENRMVELNGDGRLDLVVENYGSHTVSILLGRGDGTFQPKVDYATATGPWSMDVGDVDGDGVLDVVTGNYAAHSASVLLGNGDGTFRARTDYTTGAGTAPECLRMGDVDGDGALDIFTANAGTNNVSILLGDGDGAFAAPVTFSTPSHPTSIDLADLNGDGKKDLATANYSAGSVSVLMGNGDGTFAGAVNYAASGNPQTVLAADLDRDGHLDLSTVNWGTNNASILLNRGDGTYRSAVHYALGNGPFSFSVIDLNQDTAPDLVTTNFTGDSVSVLFGNGDGTFVPRTDLGAGDGTAFIALGDLDGDGYGDLVTTDLNAGTVSVFRGTAFLGAAFSGKADGVWYFHVRAVNADGVGGPTTTREVRIDCTAPQTDDGSEPALAADGDSAWRQSGQTVILQASDAHSGLAHTYYTLDGVEYEYDGPFSVVGDGSHAITWWSVDAAGNAETAHSGWVNIDGDAPHSSDASTPALALDQLSGWQNVPQLVTLAAVDAGEGVVSGVAGVEYDLDGAGYAPYAAPFVVAAEGSHVLRFRATDRAGNVEDEHVAYVNVDVTPPTISSSADGDTAWRAGDTDVTLTAGDAGGSGLAAVQWRLAGETAWADVAGSSFTVPAPSADGPVNVEYRAVDGAGNETTGGCTLQFDVTAPETTHDYAGGLDWQSGDVHFSLQPGDAGSGVAATEWSVDGGAPQSGTAVTVTGDGEHTVSYFSTDNAGNAETPHQVTVRIDTQAPETTDDYAGGLDWQSGDVHFSLQPGDAGSGVAATEWSVDGGEPQSGTAVTVTGDGEHTVSYFSTDASGRVEAPHSVTVRIDTQAPQTTDDYAGGDAWQTGPVSFSLAATDALSGVDGTSWSVDGGEPQSGTDVTVTGDGEHTVTYSSTDNAGNAETPGTVAVRIDAGAPATGDDAPTGWVTEDTAVTLTPVDALSGMTGGLAGTTWELDGGATQTGTSVLVAAPSDHSGDGARTITYRSSDAVGNRETDRSATVRVDTLAPVTRDDIVAGPPAHTDPLTVTLSASDEHGSRAVSGVATTHYRVDDGEWQTGTSVEITGDGEHTVSYYSVDNAGNAEAVRTSGTLTLATTPPGASGDDAPAGWVNHSVTVTLTPGARALRTTWELDGGLTQTGTSVAVAAPADHSGDGTRVITYRSWAFGDVAEPTRTTVVRVDTAAPRTTDDAPAGWRGGPVTVTLAAEDAASGVAATTWSLDGGAVRHGTSVPVSGDGVHTITYASADNAGNAEPVRTATVRIDGTAPQASCAQAGRWYKTPALTAAVVASDAGSGLASVEYRLDQGSWQQGTSVPVAGPGAHTLSYRATDVCGNVTSGQCAIGIDVKKPLKVKALASKGKKKPGKLTLKFRIADPKPSCGGAIVNKIVVTNAKGRKVATIKGVTTVVKTNAKVKLVVKKKLKRGSYRFRVLVTDIAGNKGKKALPGKLTVR